ncbi:hypothetical protein EV664_102466 [Stakelama pacifica]|uniref:Uncharacterized protein n=1 Tax=Stakelama pacifica TaxID=517720 RepID=A0A4R6FV34_9SPHN|nr:hypothetical protein EV664_102466 [Stakelama pacifica]
MQASPHPSGFAAKRRRPLPARYRCASFCRCRCSYPPLSRLPSRRWPRRRRPPPRTLSPPTGAPFRPMNCW